MAESWDLGYCEDSGVMTDSSSRWVFAPAEYVAYVLLTLENSTSTESVHLEVCCWKGNHKLVDEQRKALPFPCVCVSQTLSFFTKVVVSISLKPFFSNECLKRWKDKEKNGDKREEVCVTTLPLWDCSWKTFGMGEMGTEKETEKEGENEKNFSNSNC